MAVGVLPRQPPIPATLWIPHYMLVTGMGVFKKPRQRGLHGGKDRVRPCLPVLAWCHVCVHTCTRAHTPPHPPHTPTPTFHPLHRVACGHTWDGRTGGAQPDPLTFQRSHSDAACEPGCWAPHQILQRGGASQAVIPCEPTGRSLWSGDSEAPGHSWQRGEPDARRAVRSRTRKSLRQPWPPAHLGLH